MNKRYGVGRAIVIHALYPKVSDEDAGECTDKWDTVTLGIDYSTPDRTAAIHAH